MLFNFIFAFFIMVTAVFFGLHFYPAFRPDSTLKWIALFVVGTFCIVVAEALADNLGFMRNWPKAQRLIVIVMLCNITGIVTLHYIAQLPH